MRHLKAIALLAVIFELSVGVSVFAEAIASAPEQEFSANLHREVGPSTTQSVIDARAIPPARLDYEAMARVSAVDERLIGANCAAASLIAIGKLSVPMFIHPQALYNAMPDCFVRIHDTDAKPGDIVSVVDRGVAQHFVALLPNGQAFTRFGSGGKFKKGSLEFALSSFQYKGVPEYWRWSPRLSCALTRFQEKLDEKSPEGQLLRKSALEIKAVAGLDHSRFLTAGELAMIQRKVDLMVKRGRSDSVDETPADKERIEKISNPFESLQFRILFNAMQMSDSYKDTVVIDRENAQLLAKFNHLDTGNAAIAEFLDGVNNCLKYRYKGEADISCSNPGWDGPSHSSNEFHQLIDKLHSGLPSNTNFSVIDESDWKNIKISFPGEKYSIEYTYWFKRAD